MKTPMKPPMNTALNTALKTLPDFARIGEENAFRVLARVQDLQKTGRDIINLGIGQPDFPTPEHITRAAVKAIYDGHHGYTDARGMVALREAVCADLLRRTNTEIHPDSVLITPGGKVVMYLAIALFGQAGAEILYPDPGFPIYRSLIEYSGATPIPIPIRESNNFAFNAEETLSLITDKTALIIVNSPANPCGGVSPRGEIDALVKGLADRPDIAILSDEIYGQMCYDGQTHTSLLSYPEIRDRLIVLDGWSKTYAMTGWRLGYGIFPPALYEPARKLAVNCWSCVNAPTQWAGLAALTGSQDCVADMVEEFDNRRQIMVAGLNAIEGISCIAPKGAFYAFPNITKTGYTAADFAEGFLETAGVATIGGTDFGVMGEGYVRFSCASSTESIKTALDRLGGFIAG